MYFYITRFTVYICVCISILLGFTQYMLSDDNDLFKRSHSQVYQDMTQPLSHYFIASSHNT